MNKKMKYLFILFFLYFLSMSKSNYIPFLERPGKWIRGKFTIIHKQYGESYPYDIVPRWMEEYDLLIEFYNICKKIYQICNPDDEDEIVFDSFDLIL